MVRWKLWKKRTEADIQKARLLEAALKPLHSSRSLMLSFGVDFFTHIDFKRALAKLKESLDATNDTKYVTAIGSIITKIDSLESKSKSLEYTDKLRELERLERDFENLGEIIEQEISDL